MTFKQPGFSLHAGTSPAKAVTDVLKAEASKKNNARKAPKAMARGAKEGAAEAMAEKLSPSRNLKAAERRSPQTRKKERMANRPQPTYEGTDEFRKEKDIPKSEFKKRGVKPPSSKPSKNTWQETVNAKRKAGIGYQTTYKRDKDGKVTESGITFDDGTYLKD